MGKYDPFREFLESLDTPFVSMTFEQIEQIVGADLPRSAREYRAWWSNNSFNSTMTDAWRAAGFKSEKVDIAGGRVTFRKVDEPPSDESPPSARLSIIGCLKGTVKVQPDADLTAPTGEAWSTLSGRLHD